MFLHIRLSKTTWHYTHHNYAEYNYAHNMLTTVLYRRLANTSFVQIPADVLMTLNLFSAHAYYTAFAEPYSVTDINKLN
jgi:hypothetical protein